MEGGKTELKPTTNRIWLIILGVLGVWLAISLPNLLSSLHNNPSNLVMATIQIFVLACVAVAFLYVWQISS